jgi:hypothetical protein
MGGWFAYRIGNLLGIDTLLFNPAVIDRSIEPEIKTNDLETVTPNEPEQETPTGANHTVVFGENDSVISPSKAKSWFTTNGVGNFNFNYEPNGHRTPYEVFVKYVSSLTNINENIIMNNKNDKIITEFHRLSGMPVNENNDEFVPGLSDSPWGLAVNMITGHFPGGKNIQSVMMHNEDLIKKLDNPEVINMIEILKQYPEIIKKLKNA